MAIIASTGVAAFANNDTSMLKNIDDYTLGELQDILLANLESQSINFKIGTPEYYNFITEQLIYGTNEELKQHPQYDLLHAYMVKYKLATEEYYFTHANSIRISPEEMFYNTDSFCDKTIGQIKEDVAHEENNIEANIVTVASSYMIMHENTLKTTILTILITIRGLMEETALTLYHNVFMLVVLT